MIFYTLPTQAGKRDVKQFNRWLLGMVSGHRLVWIDLRKEPLRKGNKLLTDSFLERHPDAKLIYEREFYGNMFLYGYDLLCCKDREKFPS